MEITASINGLEINEDTPMFEIYNHIGIPSEPYVIHTHKRLPRKLKKRNKKHRQSACDSLTEMFKRAKRLAERYDTKTDTTFQKRLNEIKAILNK